MSFWRVLPFVICISVLAYMYVCFYDNITTYSVFPKVLLNYTTCFTICRDRGFVFDKGNIVGKRKNCKIFFTSTTLSNNLSSKTTSPGFEPQWILWVFFMGLSLGKTLQRSSLVPVKPRGDMNNVSCRRETTEIMLKAA